MQANQDGEVDDEGGPADQQITHEVVMIQVKSQIFGLFYHQIIIDPLSGGLSYNVNLMARVKISEFRAKKLLANALGYEYTGIQIDAEDGSWQKFLADLPDDKYVVKVDQATKKRNQLGLVRLNLEKLQLTAEIKRLVEQGWRFFLVEPMEPHEPENEHFLALQRTEEGVEIIYSKQGGVDIEAHAVSLQKQLVKDGPSALGELPAEFLSKLLNLFNNSHMTYLEINPLMIKDGKRIPLDAAVEVDSTAELGVQGAWTADDVRSSRTKKTPSENKVEELQAVSISALTLRVMNPDGKILLMLSGGGASLVVADEFDAHGLADELINYGEYSGAPNEDELYEYSLAAIGLLKDSQARQKVIVIAGGVANFTDIAVTFRGIIRAFEKEGKFLKDNDVTVFVRRGGPNQQKGLKAMEDCLAKLGLRYKIHGPELSLAELVKEVAEEVKR